MKTTATFVILQFIAGFAFGIGRMFFFPEKNDWSLNTSLFYVVLSGFICMLIGVGLVGYFHLRLKKITKRFLTALMLSFIGSVLFLFLAILIDYYSLAQVGFLILILPLTGAVFGFNLAATLRTGNEGI